MRALLNSNTHEATIARRWCGALGLKPPLGVAWRGWLRVFIFAGQSSMEGADSKVKDINRYPPFAGLEMPQDRILFSYNIGREQKQTSNGWGALQPVGHLVGPELSFARRVSQEIGAPIAIVKCAARP